jgi:hypothetical protein
MDAESELEAVFVTVGCRMEDAVRLARSKYMMRLCVPDEDAENPIDWSGPLLALAHQQSEGAWLNGCLVGLFMAGPLVQTMDPMALQTAEKRLAAEILEEENAPTNATRWTTGFVGRTSIPMRCGVAACRPRPASLSRCSSTR